MIKPATSTSGFFQENPITNKNQYLVDNGLQRALELFKPKSLSESDINQAGNELIELGAEVVTPEVYEWVDEAERNPPFIVQQDSFGNPWNKLVTSDGWKQLKKVSAVNGVVSSAYERKYAEYSRLVSFAKVYLFTPSSAMVSCPLAMTDGCAKLLEITGLTNSNKKDVYNHLISRDPSSAWTSGQWMTERPGGSDVSRSETIALNHNNEEYRLSGFKWFSSATDSEVSVVLAHRVDGNGNHLDKGKLSCFLGYVKDNNNTVRINRLKKKFGTIPVPTAELELSSMRAELVGQPGNGVRTISIVLNITRVYNAISSVAFWRRALHIAKEYSLVRSVFGQKLNQVPAHVRTLADQEISIRGYTLLSFYGAALLGREETSAFHNKVNELVLLRIIPGLSKIATCKRAISGISECMEALGGVGYLEHDVRINIGKLLRDAQVNAIWEGTTNVLCDDAVRYLHKNWKSVKFALNWLLDDQLKTHQQNDLRKDLTLKVTRRLSEWFSKVESLSLSALRRDARAIMFPLADIIISILAISDIRSTNHYIQDKVADIVASIWAAESTVSSFSDDYLVVYGEQLPEKSKL